MSWFLYSLLTLSYPSVVLLFPQFVLMSQRFKLPPTSVSFKLLSFTSRRSIHSSLCNPLLRYTQPMATKIKGNMIYLPPSSYLVTSFSNLCTLRMFLKAQTLFVLVLPTTGWHRRYYSVHCSRPALKNKRQFILELLPRKAHTFMVLFIQVLEWR